MSSASHHPAPVQAATGVHNFGPASTHVLPMSIYLGVFTALLVLTGTTVAVAFVDLGPLNNVVAMAVATLKATLVILYFMHVRYATKLTGLILISGIVWLGIMVGLTFVDYASRGWFGVTGR
jgi:cytochrome c oxidase subunit 4